MTARESELFQAIRGPVMMITLGVLVALQYFGDISFTGRTWPVLLIVFGLMKLLERSNRPPSMPPPGLPPQGAPRT